MALPTPSEIKKLAKACRQAGIKTFKCEGIEFTLDDLPVKASKTAPAASPDAGFESDELGYEQLLHWSVTDADQTNKASGE